MLQQEATSNGIAGRHSARNSFHAPAWLTTELREARNIPGWSPSPQTLAWIANAYKAIAQEHTRAPLIWAAWAELVDTQNLRFPDMPSTTQRTVLVKAINAFSAVGMPFRSQEKILGIPFRRLSTWSRTGITTPTNRITPPRPAPAYPAMTEFLGQPIPELQPSPRECCEHSDESILNLLAVIAPDDANPLHFFLTVANLAVKDLSESLDKAGEFGRPLDIGLESEKVKALLDEVLYGCEMTKTKALALSSNLGGIL